jgi:hypothetical protein
VDEDQPEHHLVSDKSLAASMRAAKSISDLASRIDEIIRGGQKGDGREKIVL